MNDIIKDLFTTQEWEALDVSKEVIFCLTANMPVHIELEQDLIGGNHDN